MYNLIKNAALMMVLAVSGVISLNAQTEKKVTINSDGSYSVIEYPMDKDVMVRLVPFKGVSSTGMAHVMRTSDGTKVTFDIEQAPGDWKNVYAYAVDPMGQSTYLGPITFSEGMGKAEFMTKGDRFMLVLSPNEGMTNYDSAGNYLFRSEVPTGYAVVPRGKPMTTSTVVATDSVSTTALATTYDVPMLGVSKYGKAESQFRLRFDGELNGLEAKAYLKPVGGKTQIRMNFDDLQKSPMNKRFVLWTSSSEGYTKIGQIIHAGKKDTAQIRGETALNDFGLFLTVEDIDVDHPTSTIYQTFKYVAP